MLCSIRYLQNRPSKKTVLDINLDVLANHIITVHIILMVTHFITGYTMLHELLTLAESHEWIDHVLVDIDQFLLDGVRTVTDP